MSIVYTSYFSSFPSTTCATTVRPTVQSLRATDSTRTHHLCITANGESSSFVVYRFYKWFTLHFTFFTCIIDWVCSIRTARSGGIYGACLSYVIALKLICIKSLTREQIYTYYIVLLGFFCFVQLVRSNLYNISLVAHGWSF